MCWSILKQHYLVKTLALQINRIKSFRSCFLREKQRENLLEMFFLFTMLFAKFVFVSKINVVPEKSAV